MKLTIERDGKQCLDCMFKDAGYLDHSGECLLFGKALTPKMKYGQIEYWEPCHQCDKVYHIAERE